MFTRRKLAAFILVGSMLVGVGLYLSGVPLMTLEGLHTDNFGSAGFATSSVYLIHWPVYLLTLTAIFAVVLSVFPRRE
jgi:uncharacterized BrkB/YihY/UPF0761 family membrane protein